MKFIIPAICITLIGCSTKSNPVVSPAISVGSDGVVKVEGDAKTPGKVNTKKSGGVLAIPEGSFFVFNEKLGTMSLMVSKATEMAVNRTETMVDGSVAFDPPKQPSVKEIAEAKSDFWTILGLRAAVATGIAAAIFGLVKDWNLVMYGGVAVCGAGLFGLFVQPHPILLAIVGIGVALAFVGPLIWHTKLKPLKNDVE